MKVCIGTKSKVIFTEHPVYKREFVFGSAQTYEWKMNHFCWLLCKALVGSEDANLISQNREVLGTSDKIIA